MEQMKFKTTIKCTGCLEKVTPHLDSNQSIENWEVDLKNPDKVLTVRSQTTTAEEVMSLVKRAGYEIEKL